MRYPFLNIILVLLLTISFQGFGQKGKIKAWRFVNAPDMHNVESLARVWEGAWNNDFESYDAYRKDFIKTQGVKFREIQKKYNAELFVSPGDCNSARWDSRRSNKFRTNFRTVLEYEKLDDNEVLLEAAKLCYTGLNELVLSNGFKEFFMAVGDHELGDNPWPLGSEASKSIPVFRQGFANHFTLEKPGGKSRFNKPIGKIAPRPIGTIFENTSYAKQYKNVLFITLDVFRFDGKGIELGEQGLVCGDITDDHLSWFERILKEAQHIPSIKHIVVQSHLPIIYPVRKYASSGMLMSGTSDNILLKLMRKYNVDLYLAGEVHMNTVTKDPESELIQFVGRGNNLSNYSVVTVEDEKLLVKCYMSDGEQIGDLLIDKTGAKKTFDGHGVLKPFQPRGLHIHWTFDEKTSESDFFSCVGNFPTKNNLLSFSQQDGVPFAIMNKGQLGNAYSLFGSNAELVDGVIGNAVEIGESANLFCTAIGPMYADFERTISCWINTSAKGRRLILNSNSLWQSQGQFFNLSLNEGKLEVSIRPEFYAAGKTPINDGKWHHIAIVVPKRKASLADCIMYIDGEAKAITTIENGDKAINTEQANWMTIATQGKVFKTDLAKTMNMSNFTGKLDDFCMWTRALTSEEIKKIYKDALLGISIK
jgi:hypothetical protein